MFLFYVYAVVICILNVEKMVLSEVNDAGIMQMYHWLEMERYKMGNWM